MTCDPLHEVLLQARRHRSHGEHAVAMQLLEWSLGDPVLMRERSGSYAEALAALGEVQHHLGDHRRASASYWRAIGAVPWNARVRVIALSGLAEIERARGRRDTAETLLRDALALAESAAHVDALVVAGLLEALAALSEESGRLTEAETLLDRALGMCRDGLGAEHPGVAGLYRSLGALEDGPDDQSRAEALARRALAISERAHGPGHPGVAADRAALATVLAALGRTEEAEGMLLE